MQIDLYALCWNEARMIPFFLRHYLPIVDRMVILDNQSTDDSVELLEHDRIHVRDITFDGDSLIDALKDVYNRFWKESRGTADWVIVCNLDEHLCHRDLRAHLQQLAHHGVTAVQAQGWQMISNEFPETDGRLCDVVQTGMRWTRMDKIAIFNPNRIKEINFKPGRHKAAPVGDLVLEEPGDVKLLHYKYLGLPYATTRLHELRTGLRKRDIRMKWGSKYLWSREEIVRDFNEVKRQAETVMM